MRQARTLNTFNHGILLCVTIWSTFALLILIVEGFSLLGMFLSFSMTQFSLSLILALYGVSFQSSSDNWKSGTTLCYMIMFVPLILSLVLFLFIPDEDACDDH